ncbi:hypothetical protein [Pseudonocardia sediminis]|uniref:hypothetical protein n=1 Tax=Pseudonocardia sediminis TaxID=1397368 RepID=UPI001028DA8F|nr:hypothetical protein [Pseudonocardia sediminis]
MRAEHTRAEVERIGKRRDRHKQQVVDDTAELREAVLRALDDGYSENELAVVGKVDRMTIRTWLGKR